MGRQGDGSASPTFIPAMTKHALDASLPTVTSTARGGRRGWGHLHAAASGRARAATPRLPPCGRCRTGSRAPRHLRAWVGTWCFTAAEAPAAESPGCPCPVGGDTLHRERWAGCTQRLNDTRSEPPRFPRRRARRLDPVAGETPWSPRGACDGGGEPSAGNAVAGLRVRGPVAAGVGPAAPGGRESPSSGALWIRCCLGAKKDEQTEGAWRGPCHGDSHG